MKETLFSEISKYRKPDYSIHPLILSRWSPRAMSGEMLSDEELFPLFEAARWAPSSYNEQPWRFLYVKRETPYWDRLFNLLIDFNKQWCSKAAVLGLIFSRTTFEKTNKPSLTYGMDTGAAWENMSLEACHRGLVIHGMSGFDYDLSQALIPKDHAVQAMFAVGKKAPKTDLPLELQEREIPSSRKPISEFVFEGNI